MIPDNLNSTPSHVQVTSAESHLWYWKKVTDHWLDFFYRGAAWLTAFCFGKKEERAVVPAKTKDSMLVPWWLH